MLVPSADRTVYMGFSVSGGRVRTGSGKRPAEPGFPGTLGLGRIGVLGEQVVGRERRLAEAAQESVERVLSAYADRVSIGEVDDAVHRADRVFCDEPGPV